MGTCIFKDGVLSQFLPFVFVSSFVCFSCFFFVVVVCKVAFVFFWRYHLLTADRTQ